ncbi:hypothetical protein [Roseateles violae]|uniref:Uncharacterized protein n=1 Tax=Roseateles violae TaxID=3058042 RepID=A0ABT8DPE5_9BURK|nr:hypothetical protein [Pelomonas sp. PFR6]MDN3919881.1 hypothetical protein [Pelomonas sp. PFR6]
MAAKLDQFCSSVGGMEPDDEVAAGPKFRYYYQRQVFEASCTNPSESVEIRNGKIREMWKRFENKELVCNNLQFDVVNGSVIKYAVAKLIDPFIRDVIRWEVDLNRVDQTDQRTVLDYVQQRADRAKGMATEKPLRHYYDILRQAGARHSHEL